MSRMIIVLVAALTLSLPFVSVPAAQAQPGNRQMMPVPVYYRHPGQIHWHLLGTFPRQMATRFAGQLREMGYQAKVGPLNF